MQNAKVDHFESVHLLRGIAAMLVLMAHSFRSFYFWDLPWFDNAILNPGQIGVSVFFVISGFVLPLSLQNSYRFQDFPRFLARRFVRIEPTYLASMMVAIAWVWTATRLAPNASPWQFNLSQIGAHLLYLVPFTDYKWVNEVYWTLAIEFQFYLFIGALFTIFRGAANKNLYLFGVLLLVFSSVTFLSDFCKPIQLVHSAPYFGIGMLAWLVCCYSVPTLLHVFLLSAIVLIGYLGGGEPFESAFWGAGILFDPLLEAEKIHIAIFWNDFVFPLCDTSSHRGFGACDWSAFGWVGNEAFSLSFAYWHNGRLYRSGLGPL